jgi:hypothetical protein
MTLQNIIGAVPPDHIYYPLFVAEVQRRCIHRLADQTLRELRESRTRLEGLRFRQMALIS